MFINKKPTQMTVTIFSMGRLNLYFFHKRKENGLPEVTTK